MQSIRRLRSRLYVMTLPLVVVVVFASGVIASFESKAALTRVANRHLAFKAEQLRDYFFSEWEVITQLGLDDQAEYRNAVEQSFRSYAFSLLRGEIELIAVYDDRGDPVMRIRLAVPVSDSSAGGTVSGPVSLSAGWFTSELFGEPRVGVAFMLEPFGWTVAVTELSETFFSDIQNIQQTHLVILVAAAVVMTVFLSVFIGHVTRPVERLTVTIGRITETNDLAQRARIESADEIGILAKTFNTMIETLQRNYRQVEATSLSEKQSRQLAVEREIETLYLLGRVSDFRDERTGEHLKRIGNLSALFSKLLGQDEDQQRHMRYSSPLHDIGKIGIPDSILRKRGPLTAEEYETMKRHTILGYELLKDARSSFLVEGASIALTHHEKWDGTGYPNRLAGESIPLSGRIVSVVDVFDALTSKRPYKDAWSPDRAIEHIASERGKHFDPDLVDLFMAHYPEFLALLERE